MASITAVAESSTTTDGPSFATASFTPATDDLLVIAVHAGGTALGGTLASSVGGQTYTQAYTRTIGLGTFSLFIADQLATNVSQTATFDCTGDDFTGIIIAPFRVSGMTNVGSAALLQSAARSVGGGGSIFATFGAAPLTSNPIILAACCNDNTPGLTEPTGFSVASQPVLSTPQHCLCTCFVDSGITATAPTWTGTFGGSSQALGFELDSSVPGAGHPTIKRFGGVPFASMNRGVW